MDAATAISFYHRILAFGAGAPSHEGALESVVEATRDTAGPSMPLVYSLEGVSCRLWKSAGSAPISQHVATTAARPANITTCVEFVAI